MMTLGGNKNLYEYFQFYDLNEESLQMKYKTKAAEFYKQRVILLIIVTLNCSSEALLKVFLLQMRSQATTVEEKSYRNNLAQQQR